MATGSPPSWSLTVRTRSICRRSVSASFIGGIRETQEMLDFCAAHGIVSDIEIIAIDQINTAYERILQSDVRYRFVIDLATLV